MKRAKDIFPHVCHFGHACHRFVSPGVECGAYVQSLTRLHLYENKACASVLHVNCHEL